MKKTIAVLTALCLCLSACGSRPAETSAAASAAVTSPADTAAAETESGKQIRFTDDLGTEFSFDERPKRVVALTGSFADIWCTAGGKDSLAGTADDAWTSFDLGLDESVQSIGKAKDPNLESIAALQPDLILASTATSADMALQENFRDMKLPAAYFDVSNFDEYLNMLRVCTDLTGCPERYEQYGTQVTAQVEAARAKADGSAPEVLYIRVSSGSLSVKNSSGSVLGEMLADMGCVNIADSETTLLEDLSTELILRRDPDMIFVVLQSADASAAQKTLDEVLGADPAWNSLTAVKEGRLYLMEHSLYNLKPNARWGDAYEKLAGILYPGEK